MQRDEQLSAFLDGELSESESRFLIRQLAADKEGREQFDRFNLAGDVMRGATPPTIDLGLADRVMAEIAAEPAAMITDEEDVFVAAVASGTTGAVLAAESEAKHVRWARPVISLAMAASVAFVAIVLWPNGGTIQNDAPQVAAAQFEPTSIPVPLVAASITQFSIVEVTDSETAVLAATEEREPEATWELADPEVQRRLSEYVAGYSQYSSAPAGQHSAPFVQTVGFQGRSARNQD
jgi:negative regulator of sigma E activity